METTGTPSLENFKMNPTGPCHEGDLPSRSHVLYGRPLTSPLTFALRLAEENNYS